MADDNLKPLRDALIRACEGYDADQAIRAMASAMTTILIGSTKDRDQALAALDRLYGVMRGHVEVLARPPGAANQ